jgi:hypothetical protein
MDLSHKKKMTCVPRAFLLAPRTLLSPKRKVSYQIQAVVPEVHAYALPDLGSCSRRVESPTVQSWRS